MGGFDAGALLFKIQAVGAALFQRDMQQAQQAIEGTERASRKAAAAADSQSKSTDSLAQQIAKLERQLTAEGRASETAAQKLARLKREQAEAAATAEKQRAAAQRLGVALTAVGVAAAAVVGITVAKYAEFDQAMSNVRAATMASVDDQKRLGEAALKAGADTAYSAKEAANAEEELAKAGMSVDQIVGGSLNGSLALAAAGQLAVARSAEIMATTLTQFKLPAEQAAHVADVLAAGAGKAQGSVDDLSLALQYVGPVAAGLKISLNETGGALAYLASQGILGEKAGTGLRGVIMSLTAPSNIAAKTMQQYGIEIFDSAGKTKSLAEISGTLHARLSGLTEAERSAALGRIFGNEQITTARILYDGGAAAINKWTDAVNDSGYAAEQAAIRQDNLAGDIEKLGGAFDTALIRTGSGANDVLRDMVQALTALVDWYGELPAPVQATALVFGVATAAVTLFAGAAVFLRVKFVELKAQMDLANVSMKSTALIAGGVGLALTGVLAVVGMLANAQAEAQARAESYADALKAGGDATDDIISGLQKVDTGFLGLQNFGSAADAAKTLGLSFDVVTDAVKGVPSAMDQVDAAVKKATDSFNQWTGEGKDAYNAAGVLEEGVKREAEAYRNGAHAASQAADAKKESTEASYNAADALLAEAAAADDLESQLRGLITAIMDANGQNQDAISSNAQWREALAGIKEQAKDTGTSLDQATAAGSANAAALADVAGAAQKAAQDQYKVDLATMSATDATNKYSKTLADQRKAFIDSAVHAGYNRKAVEALADSVFALPSKKEIDILADTAVAQQRIDQIISRNNNRTITLNVKTNESRVTFSNGNTASSHADGGAIHGPGGPRDDKIPAWLSNGEHVIPADEVQRAGGQDAIYRARAALMSGTGGALKFATGGAVNTWRVTKTEKDWFRDSFEDWSRKKARRDLPSGLDLVDELFKISDQVQKGAHTRLRGIATSAEKQFTLLERQADSAGSALERAKDRLADLKDAAADMTRRVADSVRSFFDVGNWAAKTTTEDRTTLRTRKVDGVNVTTSTTSQQTVTTKPTAASIRKDVATKAKAIQRFAEKLAKLSRKHLAGALLAEVAQLGVEAGEPVVDALLKASDADIKAINSGYKKIDRFSTRAGEISADANYKKLIDAAEKQVTAAKKNADAINKKIAEQTTRVVNAIADSYRKGTTAAVKKKADGGPIYGPGTSTSDSILTRLSNNEHVVTAAEVAGAGGHSAVEQTRALWRRGLPGMATGGAVRAGNQQISATQQPAARVHLEVNTTFQNPVMKDPEKEARKVGQLIAGATMRGFDV